MPVEERLELVPALGADGVNPERECPDDIVQEGDDVAAVLGVPAGFTQAALLPVAYYTGTEFRPARRLDAGQFIHVDRW